ncbi:MULTISPECIES: hypothetical protein [Halostella]|nr:MULTISPECIES: hypothetical protein [Halostella]
MGEDANTHVTEWAELIGDSVPDADQSPEDGDDPQDAEDPWNVAR